MSSFFYDQEIRRFVKRKQLFFVCRGLSLAASLSIIAAGTCIVYDVLWHAPVVYRKAAFALILGAAAWFLWLWAIRPVRRYLFDHAVKDAEKSFASLGQRLRTVHQMQEASGEAPQGVSPELVQALIQDTRLRTGDIQLDRLIRWKKIMPRAALMALLFLVMCGLSIFWQDFRTGLLRLAVPGWEWTFTRVIAESSTKRARPHEEVTIDAVLEGRLAAEAILHVQEEDGEWLTKQMDQREDRLFSTTWRSKDTSCRFFVSAGDGKSDMQSIKVFKPLEMEKALATLVFPEYTGKTPVSIEGADVEAVEGTEVDIVFTLNHPVVQAVIIMDDGSTVTPKVEGNKVSIHFKLEPGDREYYVEARNDKGLELPRVDFMLRGLVDELPKVDIVVPDPDVEVTKITELPILFNVSDDIGIHEMGVVLKVKGAAEKIFKVRIPEKNAKLRHGRTVVPLENYPLSFKDNVQYYVFAGDRKPGRKHRAVSDLRWIDIRPFRIEYRLIKGAGGGG